MMQGTVCCCIALSGTVCDMYNLFLLIWFVIRSCTLIFISTDFGSQIRNNGYTLACTMAS